MKSLRRLLGPAVLSLALLVPGTGAAAQPLDDLGDDPLLQDARQYAATYQVDLDEALGRLRLQGPIGKLAVQLAADEPATFAGIWIQHSPSYRVIVQHTAAGGGGVQRHLQDKDLAELAPAVERRTVRLSLRQLERIQTAAHRLARQSKLAADSRINVAENRVELLTDTPAAVVQAIRAGAKSSKAVAALDLPAHVEVVEVERRITPHAYVYGGLTLTDCTSGFTVQNGSGTLGISTAGHCQSVQQYNNRLLPLLGEAFSGSSDAQWHDAPGLHLTNRVFDGVSDATSPNYRPVTATKSRAAQVIGEFVCKYGMTTGHTCGTISSTTYVPSYVPGPSATFIYVDSPTQDQSEPGDSGGPWFSGETAYGIHSGGYIGGGGTFNAAVYMAIDYLAPLGVTVLTTTPDVPVGRWTYRNIGNNINYYTGINAADYECSVAGFAAIDGDINEDDSGDIIQTYLYKVSNHWQIRGDFRAHNDQESWDFDLFCVKKTAYPVSRFEYRNLGGNINYNTGLSTITYDCGIAGMAGRDGDINENGTATNILLSYMYRSGSTWWIRADFHSHHNGESWDIDVMCIQKWAPVTRHEYRNLGNNPTFNTFINSNTHVCGVAGMAVRSGDIDEHDAGDIILAYLTETSGTWTLRADFRAWPDSETWDVDLLCLQR